MLNCSKLPARESVIERVVKESLLVLNQAFVSEPGVCELARHMITNNNKGEWAERVREKWIESVTERRVTL